MGSGEVNMKKNSESARNFHEYEPKPDPPIGNSNSKQKPRNIAKKIDEMFTDDLEDLDRFYTHFSKSPNMNKTAQSRSQKNFNTNQPTSSRKEPTGYPDYHSQAQGDIPDNFELVLSEGPRGPVQNSAVKNSHPQKEGQNLFYGQPEDQGTPQLLGGTSEMVPFEDHSFTRDMRDFKHMNRGQNQNDSNIEDRQRDSLDRGRSSLDARGGNI
jgi:hypothetical protein